MIKVCGMRAPDNIQELSKLPIDLMGGIFYAKSPRFIGDSPETARSFNKLPPTVSAVGVFVNAELPYLHQMKDDYNLSYLQLHGSESPEFCENASQIAPIIKAFGLHDDFDFSILATYESVVDLFVFDTSCKEHGGSGKKFNWDILEKYLGNTPFLLSGGIGVDDVEAVKAISHPLLNGVDLNSAFEISPANKDIEKLTQFCNAYLS